MVAAAERLALLGGPKTVTAQPGDRWERVSEDEIQAVVATLQSADIYGETKTFEREFAEFVGTKHALGLCNGTAAIHSALFAVGVGPGDEVIVPSYTWHASITPILHCGGTPIFCEVDPDTYCADPADIEKRITSRTRAIVVTHVLGNPADMGLIMAIARPRGIKVIEDASHAHGGSFDGRQVGALGDVGCFSLQNSKAMSAVEGGVATTDDDEIYERMVVLGRYGSIGQLRLTDRYADLHDIGLGIKYRPNPLGMAMARVQLRRLPDLNERRRRWFATLDGALSELPGVQPQRTYPKAERGGLLLYSGRVIPEEVGLSLETFRQALAAEGVPMTPGITPFGYGKMHTEPLFNDFPMAGFGGAWGAWGSTQADPRRPHSRGSLPVTERLADEVFWLTTPVDPDPMWLDQIALAFFKVVECAPDLARRDAT